MATTSQRKKGTLRAQARRAKRERTPKPARQGKSRAADALLSLPERIQSQREQLFKALSIVQCCKYASATQLEVEDLDYMVPTCDALYELLDDAAEELERIAVGL